MELRRALLHMPVLQHMVSGRISVMLNGNGNYLKIFTECGDITVFLSIGFHTITQSHTTRNHTITHHD